MMKRPLYFKISMGRCLMLMLLMLTSIAALSQEAYSVFTEADSTLTFFYDNERSNRPGTSYLVNAQDSVPKWRENYEEVTRVVFDTTFVAARPTSTRCWFNAMEKLNSITGIKYLITDSVTDMEGMFNGCKSLTSLDLKSFNTSNVTTMRAMFNFCRSLTSLDVSGFNTSKVTDMDFMFAECESLTSIDLSGFNTTKVTTMFGMFNDCKSLTTLDVSSFNTSNVTNMWEMFAGCSSLTTLDVSNFNTSNVTEMKYNVR